MGSPSPFIVALYSDAPRAGKSTAARKLEALARAEGMAVNIMSFAHPLRRAARQVLPACWTEEQVRAHLSGHLKDRPIPELDGGMSTTGRDLLKLIGNSVRGRCGEAVWAKRMLEEIDHLGTGGVVIVDDLRFPGEYDLLRKRNAFIIRLVTARLAGSFFEADGTEGLLYSQQFAAEVPAKGLVPQEVLESLIAGVWSSHILPGIVRA